VLNAGRILVPELVSGQSQGGVAMAIGYTLLEDMPDGMAGPANGTWNLDRYHVPRWDDVPLLSAYQPGRRAQELIVLPETPGDAGAGRGIAEAVMCSIAPAISNALRDAVGKRFTSLPITPAKILKGLAS
jgi:CO/xanthine dehydrogenase Mo-binding subunit